MMVTLETTTLDDTLFPKIEVEVEDDDACPYECHICARDCCHPAGHEGPHECDEHI